MLRQVTLIRHPPPLFPGRGGICYGQLDLEVEEGTAQACCEQIRRHPRWPGLARSRHLWTSPLRRCRWLAEALFPAGYRCDPRLAEIHFGEWEGRCWDDIPRHELDAWAHQPFDFAPPGGEAPRAVLARALDWLDDALSATQPGEDVVAVTHAGVMRLLWAEIKGRPLEEALNFKLAFGEVLCLEW